MTENCFVYGTAVFGWRYYHWQGASIFWVGLVDVWVETWLYKIVSLPELRESRALLVAVEDAKKGSWAQNCEGDKLKRDDK